MITLKLKRFLAIVLLFVLIMTSFAGCGDKPAQLPGYKVSAEIPEGVLLPFDDGGKWVWPASEIKETSIEYWREREEWNTFTSNLSNGENAQAFVDMMNGISKELIGAEIQPLISDKIPFSEFDLGAKIYHISLRISERYGLAFVYQAADCCYLWFRLDFDNNDVYYYSLYKIDLNDFHAIEQLFESFDKTNDALFGKPVIYLYPEEERDVRVRLDFRGSLSVSYPVYNGGWEVRAFPDGRLINKADGLEYSYLFWEGYSDSPEWWDLSEGYCVTGADAALFLQKTLGGLGLTPREYNELIVYWLPQLQDNRYNLISFQWREYERIAPLYIEPEPDSVLRVFMIFAPLENPVEIKAPGARETFERKGFTVVEWGASKIEYKKSES